MTKQFQQHIHYNNHHTVTIVLCIVGPLRPSKNSNNVQLDKYVLFFNICPLLIYVNINNMIVGFSISFILLMLQYYSLTITTNVSSFI